MADTLHYREVASVDDLENLQTSGRATNRTMCVAFVSCFAAGFQKAGPSKKRARSPRHLFNLLASRLKRILQISTILSSFCGLYTILPLETSFLNGTSKSQLLSKWLPLRNKTRHSYKIIATTQ